MVPVIRYIGKTGDLEKRFSAHLNDSSKLKTHLGRWLKSLAARGEKPVLMTLNEVPDEIGSAAEILYIRLAREGGMDLCNLTDGGEGFLGYKKGPRSPEVRRRISESSKGKIKTPEHCRALSEAHKGRMPSDSCRAASVVANTGRKKSEEERRKRSESCRGLKHSDSSSKFIGVSFREDRQKWVVFAPKGSGPRYVGSFRNEIDAARAYDDVIVRLIGPTAKLNFPHA